MALKTKHKKTQSTSPSISYSKNSISIFNIPKEVIIHKILISMEPKTLGRLCCVSIWWNKLISSPSFYLLYYRFRSIHRLHFQICWNIDQIASGTFEHLFSTIDLACPSDPHEWTLILRKQYMPSWMVSQSSYLGLICIYSKNNACLYNPTTRTIVVNLPPFNNNSHCYQIFYLGFVDSTNRLKVLCFSTYIGNSRINPSTKEINVLTLPEDLCGGWRKVDGPSLPMFVTPIVADAGGAVYVFSPCYKRLFRFDLERERWLEIKLPTISLSQAMEFMGYLCLRSRTTESSYDLWIFKNNVWVKEWVLNDYPNTPKELLIPLHYDEKLKRILMEKKNVVGCGLCWYWIKTGTYDECHFKFPRTKINHIKYVETLVSLQAIRDIANVSHQP